MIYIILYLIIILSLNKKLKNKNKLLLLLILIISIIFGLRSDKIGSDTMNYVRIYNNVTIESFLYGRLEKGYILYNLILKKLDISSQNYLLITSLLIGISIYKFIKENSYDKMFSIYIFWSLHFYYFTISGLRQSLALILLFFSYNYIIKNIKISFFLFFLAVLFHNSAIAFIFVYLIRNIKFKKYYSKIILVSCIIIYFFGMPIILKLLEVIGTVSRSIDFNYYINYAKNPKFFKTNRISIYIQILFILFMYFLQIKKINDKSKKENILTWITSFALLTSVLALKGSVINRLVINFYVFIIIIIPNSLKELEYKIKYKYIKIIFILVVFIYHWIIFIYRPEWNRIYPYEFLINNGG